MGADEFIFASFIPIIPFSVINSLSHIYSSRNIQIPNQEYTVVQLVATSLFVSSIRELHQPDARYSVCI